MEIPVEAPAAGTVLKIHVQPEQVFEENDPLMDLDVA